MSDVVQHPSQVATFHRARSDAVSTPTRMRIHAPAQLGALLSTGGTVGADTTARGDCHTSNRNPAPEHAGSGPLVAPGDSQRRRAVRRSLAPQRPAGALDNAAPIADHRPSSEEERGSP